MYCQKRRDRVEYIEYAYKYVTVFSIGEEREIRCTKTELNELWIVF